MSQCRPQDDTTRELGSQVHVHGVPHGGQFALQLVRLVLRHVMYMHVLHRVHDMCRVLTGHMPGMFQPNIHTCYALHDNPALQYLDFAAQQS